MDRGRRRGRGEKQRVETQDCCPSSLQKYKVIAILITCSIVMTINSVLVKKVRQMSTAELAFVRNIGIFIFNLPFFLKEERTSALTRASVPSLIARGLLGVCNLYFLYLSLKLIPISDVAVISSMTPIWVVILSRFILKERLDLLNSLSILLTVIGLVLMSRVFSFVFSSPSEKYSDLNYWFGCLCALLNSLLLAFIHVLLRKLRGIDVSVTLFFHSTIGALGMAFIVMISMELNLPECGLDGLYVVVLGVLSYGGQMLMTMAFRMEKAGAVSSVRTSSQVVVSFLFQLAFFNDKIDIYSILAAVCMFIALWLSGMRKYFQEKRRKKAVKDEASRNNVCETETKV